MKLFPRILCVFLCLTLLLPASALAEGGDDEPQETAEVSAGDADEAEEPAGPVIISEVCPANSKTAALGNHYYDWVELQNISDTAVNLKDYYLSDDKDDPLLWQLPDAVLQPGAYQIIYCDSDLAEAEYPLTKFCAPFSIDSDGEKVRLSTAEETVDKVKVKGTAFNGSIGRMDGETGWFYFSDPTPGTANTDGYRSVSAEPEASVAGGVYEDIESLTVSLTAPEGSTIWYTTEAEMNSETMQVYSGPLTFTETTVLRAYCQAPDCCIGNTAVWSYIINEGDTLPVVSVVADSYRDFTAYYNAGIKNAAEIAGNIAYYKDGQTVFQKNCGLSLKGFTSTTDPYKKNIGIAFSDQFGSSKLKDCDLFGNGITEYSNLLLRTGQDHDLNGALIRNELFEQLCAEGTDVVTTHSNQYCVLYINGNYRGIYSLKEQLNRSWYATIEDVSKSSITEENTQHPLSTELTNAMWSVINGDQSDPEVYAAACEAFDMDNFIDYVIFESYAANIDYEHNVRLYKSTETDGKWRFVFNDLDQTWYQERCAVFSIWSTGYGKPSNMVRLMLASLSKSDTFRSAMLQRYGELIQTTLSDEHVLQTINALAAEIESDVARDREHFNIPYKNWTDALEKMRAFVDGGDYARVNIDHLCEVLNVKGEEYDNYIAWVFGS